MMLSNIKKFCTLVTKTFFKTLKSISSSGTGGLKILSKDEIQVFKNLRPRVPEELILFNVLKKVLVTRVQNCLIFDKIILKILGIIKSH